MQALHPLPSPHGRVAPRRHHFPHMTHFTFPPRRDGMSISTWSTYNMEHCYKLASITYSTWCTDGHHIWTIGNYFPPMTVISCMKHSAQLCSHHCVSGMDWISVGKCLVIGNFSKYIFNVHCRLHNRLQICFMVEIRIGNKWFVWLVCQYNLTQW